MTTTFPLRSTRSALCAAMLAWAWLGGTPALAQGADDEPPGYRAIIDSALAEFDAQNYEEAHALLLQAHATFPNARTLRGLGMAEFELRRYLDSIAHLEQALASTIRPLDGELRQGAEVLLARARQYVARVTVGVSPAVSAEWLVDGIVTAPAADGGLVLQIGEHMLEARAPGYRMARQKITVAGGKPQSIQLTLEPGADAAATGTTAPGAALSQTPSEAKKDAGSSSVWKSPWLWIGAGVVIAGVVTAVVLASSAGEPDTVTADPVRTPNSPPGVVVMALQ